MQIIDDDDEQKQTKSTNNIEKKTHKRNEWGIIWPFIIQYIYILESDNQE